MAAVTAADWLTCRAKKKFGRLPLGPGLLTLLREEAAHVKSNAGQCRNQAAKAACDRFQCGSCGQMGKAVPDQS